MAMEYRVPDEIMLEADKCPYDFSCLSSRKCGDRKMREVRWADGKNVLFLNTEKRIDCPYRMMFGFGQICTCPVRFATHLKYEGDVPGTLRP